MSRAKNGSKTSGANQNLVTILFVLGIIGWGFFAIDRLTESDTPGKVSRTQGRALGHESGWKKSARDWLNKKLSSAGTQKVESGEAIARNVPQREAIPLMSDPQGLHVAEENGAKPGEVPAESPGVGTGTFYFYRLNQKGQPVLTGMSRQADAEDMDLKARISELIKGPSTAEQDKDYIDSFIRKPRVLGAKMEGQCAVVNFDANFGAGVSTQTPNTPNTQLFRNVQAWEHATCLELKVAGKYVPYLGTDGLYFPKRIDAAWLKQNL